MVCREDGLSLSRVGMMVCVGKMVSVKRVV